MGRIEEILQTQIKSTVDEEEANQTPQEIFSIITMIPNCKKRYEMKCQEEVI